jgi:hypothetical protein
MNVLGYLPGEQTRKSVYTSFIGRILLAMPLCGFGLDLGSSFAEITDGRQSFERSLLFHVHSARSRLFCLSTEHWKRFKDSMGL